MNNNEAKSKYPSLFEPWYTKVAAYIMGGIIGIVIFSFATIPIIIWGTFAQGFVGMKLWNWFIFDHIPGAPAMTILNAAGIAVLCRLFTYENLPIIDEDSSNTKKNIQKLIVALIAPWIALLIGYIIHRLM